ncbi:hypothetical protein GCM10022216_35390 [Sphingobacterium kyonggiense]|uniref:Uncharacterized protein n=1 Tax=Sphingobacterium kyonggiense TaxID=714075 RepID=A0ABP7Z752_9SPHI
MKKIYYIIALISFLFLSCNREEFKVFEVEDVWGSETAQLDLLVSNFQENKFWEVVVQDGHNKSAHYGFLNINEASSADFMTDFSPLYSSFSKTNFQLRAFNRSAIINFPKESKFAKMSQDAVYIDTTFALNKIVKDTLFFLGTLKKSTLKLIPSSNEKYNALKQHKIKETKASMDKIFEMPRYFFRIHKGAQSFEISRDTVLKTINFYYEENNKVITKFVQYYYDADGLVFLDPVRINGTVFDKIKVKSVGTSSAEFQDNIRITNEAEPLVYDQVIARSFNNYVHGSGWGSRDGFSTRKQTGIGDVYKIREYLMVSIFPVFINEDNPPVIHGLFGFVLLNGGISPGIEFPLVEFTDEGLLTFTVYQMDSYYGPDIQIKKSKEFLRPMFYNEKGFYVLQRNNEMVLVDARDALTWIHLRPIYLSYDQ